VILIIAMTLIAVLGAGFVSIVGSKHEGFSHLISAQKANVIAKAGVEWAIRYISDGLGDTSTTYYTNSHTQPATDKVFADGTFSVGWTYNPSDISSDYITVTGTFRGVTETVTLSNFRRYLKPITLIPNPAPNQKPSYSSDRKSLNVRVMGNDNTSITQIDLTTAFSGSSTNMVLRHIYGPGGTPVFDYTNTSYETCNFSSPVPPCVYRDWVSYWPFFDKVGILLRSTELFGPAGSANGGKARLLESTINPNSTYNYIFEFYDSAPSSTLPHTVRFYSHSATLVSEVKFKP